MPYTPQVDIDNSPIELSVVHAILADPSLARRVDELFFEYHFFEPHWYFGWWFDPRKGPHKSVDDALSLMQRLRSRGIRAHFWV